MSNLLANQQHLPIHWMYSDDLQQELNRLPIELMERQMLLYLQHVIPDQRDQCSMRHQFEQLIPQ